ncbi:carbamoyltransferase HypF [Microbulbifer harenosus]|uniref:Carbamoyltransferase HypF n=1 Tax=Microbulbifer harenosus TaxID=2576840 RepID=A0ABY2UFQ3_9GAMM|nr:MULTISPECIES: carbamoyltransferase HypF [Microbulbifer]QIL89205.1 carbamoyltransferase HypF [Microbulbifer sp. SH-1]TLM76434.1 carbamoyltransferase HypF [Microbulbifer harenosus]
MKAETPQRLLLDIRGLVQGVGFRPFVYRLAVDCGLSGWVANNGTGVSVEVQGRSVDLCRFLQALPQEKPSLAEIESLSSASIPLQQDSGFRIRASETGSAPMAGIPPDLAPCDDCLRELFDAGNRRFRYPFINCTACGPRFSIVEHLPYDRTHTAMKPFHLCAACQREYDNPADRRFHAEPIACADCGPRLLLQDQFGNVLASGDDALMQAAADIATGQIVAIKGVGGIQLLVDAANTAAVEQLRARKRRPHKPFALMYPDIQRLRADCLISELEESCLCSPQRPILLLKARPEARASISAAVAPANPDLGAMLPSSPLHHLLLQTLQRTVVATSGNLSGEPICIDNDEAIHRLGNIADRFLLHDRAILRPLDDSVVRVMDGQPVLLRRARGYAPAGLALPLDAAADEQPWLALGADLKNCVAVCHGNTTYLSPHIGDLQDRITLQQFERAIADIAHVHGLQPENVLCDQHPGYVSTRWAHNQHAHNRYAHNAGEGSAVPMQVQHHVAHFFSCMAEHQFRGAAAGICWDGTGFGDGGRIYGSECLHWNGQGSVNRIARLREFPLPGGEQAIREPRRVLAGLLFECLGEKAFSNPRLQQLFDIGELAIVRTALERGINTPRCSSMGRLFDAVAAILGLVDSVSFEGQAAMTVEYAAEPAVTDVCYPFQIQGDAETTAALDWEPLLMSLLAPNYPTSSADRAAAFHTTLAHMALAAVHRAGEQHVFLSGGVFQNRRLLESTAALLRQNGFQVLSHRKVPPNDGGIALGQLYYARCMAHCREAYGQGGALCV